MLNVLRALEAQGQFDKYEILVSNNKSDYDVNEWLGNNLGSDFLKIITIYNWRYNVGGDINISSVFLKVNTPWMWLSSDDDMALPNALSVLLGDIEKFSDVCWIKYSIKGHCPFLSMRHNQISEILSVFCHNGHFFGEMVFMGNNVYNMEKLKPYIGKIPLNAKTSMPQLIAPFWAISNKNEFMAFSPDCLTNYEAGHISYKLIYAYLNFGNLLYSGILKTRIDIKMFRKMRFASVPRYVKALMLGVDDKYQRWEYLKKIYIAHFDLFSFRGFYFVILYCVMSMLPSKLLLRILHKD